eukprot:jgi/Mesvir1/16480/Mv10038-RA.2
MEEIQPPPPMQIEPSALERKALLPSLTQIQNKIWLKKRGIAIKPELTPAQHADLKECFELMDADGSGAIDADELMTAFEVLGLPAKRSHIIKTLAAVDSDGSGEVEYEEFIQIMTGELHQEDNGLDDDDNPEKTKAKARNPLPFKLLATAYRRKMLVESLIERDEETMQKMVRRANLAQSEREAAIKEAGTNEWAKATRSALQAAKLEREGNKPRAANGDVRCPGLASRRKSVIGGDGDFLGSSKESSPGLHRSDGLPSSTSRRATDGLPFLLANLDGGEGDAGADGAIDIERLRALAQAGNAFLRSQMIADGDAGDDVNRRDGDGEGYLEPTSPNGYGSNANGSLLYSHPYNYDQGNELASWDAPGVAAAWGGQISYDPHHPRSFTPGPELYQQPRGPGCFAYLPGRGTNSSGRNSADIGMLARGSYQAMHGQGRAQGGGPTLGRVASSGALNRGGGLLVNRGGGKLKNGVVMAGGSAVGGVRHREAGPNNRRNSMPAMALLEGGDARGGSLGLKLAAAANSAALLQRRFSSGARACLVDGCNCGGSIPQHLAGGGSGGASPLGPGGFNFAGMVADGRASNSCPPSPTAHAAAATVRRHSGFGPGYEPPGLSGRASPSRASLPDLPPAPSPDPHEAAKLRHKPAKAALNIRLTALQEIQAEQQRLEAQAALTAAAQAPLMRSQSLSPHHWQGNAYAHANSFNASLSPCSSNLSPGGGNPHNALLSPAGQRSPRVLLSPLSPLSPKSGKSPWEGRGLSEEETNGARRHSSYELTMRLREAPGASPFAGPQSSLSGRNGSYSKVETPKPY